jgi:hypothetical protein
LDSTCGKDYNDYPVNRNSNELIYLGKVLRAIKLVKFMTSPQGLVTKFTRTEILFNIFIPQFSFGLGEAKLSQSDLLTNMIGHVDNTEKVNGTIISEGECHVVSHEFGVDILKRLRYTFFTTMLQRSCKERMNALLTLFLKLLWESTGWTNMNRLPYASLF